MTTAASNYPGLDLVVVVDIQRGWDGGEAKISEMKKAMESVITKLAAADRLAVVTCNGVRQCQLTWMTPDGQTSLKALVNGLTNPTTNLQDALVEAMAVLRGRSDAEAGRRAVIFFLTDDKEGRGDARSVDPGDVAVHTFGFGKKAGQEVFSVFFVALSVLNYNPFSFVTSNLTDCLIHKNCASIIKFI